MEILGERPVWSMSGSEMVSSLDAAFAEIARLQTFVLHLIGGLETTGYAQEVGAGTTARLLTFRYRIDPTKARRDVHLATTLDKFPAVAAALPNPNPPEPPGRRRATVQAVRCCCTPARPRRSCPRWRKSRPRSRPKT